jgi:hypothetical protein
MQRRLPGDWCGRMSKSIEEDGDRRERRWDVNGGQTSGLYVKSLTGRVLESVCLDW